MTAPAFTLTVQDASPRRRGRGATDDWLTPPSLLAALGPFDLDPCASAAQPWPTACQQYTRADNGLLLPWFGRIWLNPPFSAWARWIARMAGHRHGTALLPARIETAAFHEHVLDGADAMLVLRGRIDFHRPDGSPADRRNGADFATVLVAYGGDDVMRLADAGLDGRLVLLTRRIALLLRPPQTLPSTWRDLVRRLLQEAGGSATLPDLYARAERSPKAARNPNFRAKIRQVVQGDGFRRLNRGTYALTDVSA